eukprot:282493-Chlamydomonas_euryale.AAC.7
MLGAAHLAARAGSLRPGLSPSGCRSVGRLWGGPGKPAVPAGCFLRRLASRRWGESAADQFVVRICASRRRRLRTTAAAAAAAAGEEEAAAGQCRPAQAPYPYVERPCHLLLNPGNQKGGLHLPDEAAQREKEVPPDREARAIGLLSNESAPGMEHCSCGTGVMPRSSEATHGCAAASTSRPPPLVPGASDGCGPSGRPRAVRRPPFAAAPSQEQQPNPRCSSALGEESIGKDGLAPERNRKSPSVPLSSVRALRKGVVGAGVTLTGNAPSGDAAARRSLPHAAAPAPPCALI